MAKHKLARFEALRTYNNVIQPSFEEVFGKKISLNGHWNELFFKNDKPIVLELGCGKGEYTIALSKKYPEKNYIGVDIKGSRMFIGATQALNEGIANAAFLRTRIEFIASCFAEDEVSEIWITFPDPQPQLSRANKRLTSARFLESYRGILKEGGIIHLKTDAQSLYDYTSELLVYNAITPIISTSNLYRDLEHDDILSVQTHYEKLFSEKGHTIKYLSFKLPPKDVEIKELPKPAQE